LPDLAALAALEHTPHASRSAACECWTAGSGRNATQVTCALRLPSSQSQPSVYFAFQSIPAFGEPHAPFVGPASPWNRGPAPRGHYTRAVHRRGHLGWHDPCRPSAFRLGARRQALRLGTGAAAAIGPDQSSSSHTSGSAPSAGRRALRRPPGRIAAACRGSDRRGLDEVFSPLKGRGAGPDLQEARRPRLANIRISCRPSPKPGNTGLEPDSRI
ncbi:MAG: hypothetical protein FD161_4992, partial [Limisphaerales bacterium]